MNVAFYKHSLGDAELESLRVVLDSTFLTTGPRTSEFEQAFATYLGTTHAVGVSSWTTGGFIALKSLGIGAGDEVITTPLTFVATANIILEAGATPVFADVESSTGNISAEAVRHAITSRTKAVLPVHLYGLMCDMRAIRDIANEHALAVIEDAAHCVEGTRDGIRPGALSDAAVFSFYATKNITCGEGGAIATNSPELYRKLLKLRLHGIDRSPAERYGGSYQHYDMDSMGYKCNMSDIQAALLLPQLDRLVEQRHRREEICRRYEAGLSGVPGVRLLEVLPNAVSARHLITILVPMTIRDRMLEHLSGRGIGVAVNFRSLGRHSFYRGRFGLGTHPVAEEIGDSTITLPLYPTLSEDEVDYVIECVRAGVRAFASGGAD